MTIKDATMIAFQKYAYEEVFRYYEFARDDGKDGLASGETLSSQTVTCTEKIAGTDRTVTMISDTSIIDSTKVSYKLKAGAAGTIYYVDVRVVTSSGQKLEGKIEVEVI